MKPLKRQKLPAREQTFKKINNAESQNDLGPLLKVVATPIGNLGDLSLRAKDALAQADIIFCEDTRSTKNLFRALGLALRPQFVRLDQHTKSSELFQALLSLKNSQGFCVLVSDAGTPGINDPGPSLVALARAQGVKVEVIPGPSALSAAISGVGWDLTSGFCFRGFFPREEKSQKTEIDFFIKTLESEPKMAFFWFESPHRLQSLVTFLKSQIGSSHLSSAIRCVFVKELTKLHEVWFEGEIHEVIEKLEAYHTQKPIRGEWVFGLSRNEPKAQKVSESRQSGALESWDPNWEKSLRCLMEVPVSSAEAAKILSRIYGISRQDVYAAIVRLREGKK